MIMSLEVVPKSRVKSTHVSVTCPCDIFCACAVFHSEGRRRNHLSGVGADDVYTKDTVSVLLYEELDKAFHVLVCLRSGVGEEGELSDLVLSAFGLEFLLVLTNPRNLGMSVHNRGDDSVVDVSVT